MANWSECSHFAIQIALRSRASRAARERGRERPRGRCGSTVRCPALAVMRCHQHGLSLAVWILMLPTRWIVSARLQMVSCASSQALAFQAPPPTAPHWLLRSAETSNSSTSSCLSIHNATHPGTCNHAISTKCSLVLAPCDATNPAMLWSWKTPGHLCTIAGNDCLDRAHIVTDWTTLHVSLYTSRLSNHAWHLSPRAEFLAGLVQLVSNCTDAPCEHHQCVGKPPGEHPRHLAAAGTQATCTSDDECNLNGLCRNGRCKCFAPWVGETCGVLDELPAPRAAAFGLNCGMNCSGPSPHTASWGGNVVFTNGTYHMFVSPLTQECGLLHWMTNMDVVHAVADSPLGPFAPQGIALPPFSTNPHAIVDSHGDWWLFHIGNGDNRTEQVHCQPNRSATDHTSFRHAPPPPPPTPSPQQPVHKARGPGGPWTAQPSPSCNNPGPAIARLGASKREVRLICSSCASGDLCVHRSAQGFGGPWEKPVAVATADKRRGARWEDPFLWQDLRGHWHVIAHVFASEHCGTSDPKSVTPSCNPVSGHLFSRDGLTNWTTSDVEPYSFVVKYDDGTSGLLATRERPKLFFDPITGEPTHLYNAAAPMPPGGCKSCTHPRKAHDAGACVGCKTNPPWGRAVYTMVTPLSQTNESV